MIPCGVWIRPTLAWLLVDSCRISNRKKSLGWYAQSGKSSGPRSFGGGGFDFDAFDFVDNNREGLRPTFFAENNRTITGRIENATTASLLDWYNPLHDKNMIIKMGVA